MFGCLLYNKTDNANGNRNQFLNFLKGIGCMGVVFIHITFPGIIGQVLKILSSFAVPVFFMIAGYYALDCDDTIIKRRLIKMVKILIYGYLVFLGYNVAFQMRMGGAYFDRVV